MMTQKTKTLYDRQFNDYSKKINETKGAIKLKRIVYETLGKVKNKNILFIGCGNGGECLPAIKAGANVIGIDLSERAIEIAKNSYKKRDAKFYCMDFEKINFKTNFFEIIVSINSIMYKNKKDLIKLLKEFRRILKTKGTIIIAAPHPVRKMMKYNKMNYFVKGWRSEIWKGIKRIDYYLLFEDYSDVFIEANLRLIKIIEPKPVKESPDTPDMELNYPHFVIFKLVKS